MELSPQAAAQEWSKGSFRPAYLFYGEDEAAKLAALETLKGALNPDPMNVAEFPGDSDAGAAEALATLNTSPMFSERRLVLVKNLRYGVAARRDLAAYLARPMPGATLVLLSGERKLDAKDPLAGALASKGGAVGFKALKEPEAVSRLREEAKRSGFALSEEAAQRLVEEAGTEWGTLKSELEKLRLFVRGRDRADADDVGACLGFRKETNPFDFPRCLQARDSRRALALLARMLEEDADPFRLLYQIAGTLNRQLKAKRLLQAGRGPEGVFRELRLNAYYDKDYLAQLARISEERLRRDLRACLMTETDLKSKSWLDPAVELTILVAGICATGPRRQ